MTIKGLIDEDFVNYKVPSMSIMFPSCTFKCGAENCQNNQLMHEPDYDIDYKVLVERYLKNDISQAIVMQGMEPFDSFSDLEHLIFTLRDIYNCEDDVVIYTGYNKEEIERFVMLLEKYPNIIIKYGRYRVGDISHFDPVLGVNLASDNQYAERIS